jgi:hypothetical protein
MNTYAKRKLKYSRNENFNLLHYVKREHKRTEGYVIVSNQYRVLFDRYAIGACVE